MICNFTHFSIALLWFLPVFSSAQTEPMDLSLEQSLTLLRSENKSLRIAGKEVELAKNEHQKLNACVSLKSSLRLNATKQGNASQLSVVPKPSKHLSLVFSSLNKKEVLLRLVVS